MKLGTQTITRKGRAGDSTTDDDYGNEIPGTAGSALSVTGCSVQPGGGLEVGDRREATTTLYTVWAPESADIVETDTVTYAGTDYAVDGPVERWDVGTALDHLVIRLKAVAG